MGPEGEGGAGAGRGQGLGVSSANKSWGLLGRQQRVGLWVVRSKLQPGWGCGRSRALAMREIASQSQDGSNGQRRGQWGGIRYVQGQG